jgi:sulfite exporter TauE/SafE
MALMGIMAAFVLGFLGSLHCLGMCGPIALALPVHQKPPMQRILAIWLYNSGRIITYGFLGLAAGSLGSGLIWMGLQRSLSLTLGILLLAGLFVYKFPMLKQFNVLQRFWSGLQMRMGTELRRNGDAVWLLLGILNGLLPCGMVYAALTAAIATGTSINGALFMVVFGLGTFPAMFSVSIFNQLFKPIRKKLSYVSIIATAITAIVLIARGLSHTSNAGNNDNEKHTILCIKPR